MTEQAIVTAIMEVPVASVTGRGYVPEWVANFRLTRGQGEELRRLKSGLIGVGATLEGGRRVESDASVFQWLLENVAKARGDAEGMPEYETEDAETKTNEASRETTGAPSETAGGLPGTEQIAK